MMGDIHQFIMYTLENKARCGYSSSFQKVNKGEYTSFNGCLEWGIKKNYQHYYKIKNEWRNRKIIVVGIEEKYYFLDEEIF